MVASQVSTTAIVIGMVVAAAAFPASLPVLIRDSPRPRPPPVREKIVVHEPRPHRLQERFEALGAALGRLRPRAARAASGRPVVHRRAVLAAAAGVVALSLLTTRGRQTRRLARR